MKKLFIMIMISLILGVCSQTVVAAEKSLTFTWDQTLPEPNDLSHFTLYEYDSIGTLTGSAFTIPYVLDMSYSYLEVITVADNQSTERCYDLTASDTNGNESEKSNRACVVIDFESPGIPTTFSITINITTQ